MISDAKTTETKDSGQCLLTGRFSLKEKIKEMDKQHRLFERNNQIIKRASINNSHFQKAANLGETHYLDIAVTSRDPRELCLSPLHGFLCWDIQNHIGIVLEWPLGHTEAGELPVQRVHLFWDTTWDRGRARTKVLREVLTWKLALTVLSIK